MASIYGKPSTLSDFKKIPIKYRNGKKPSQLLELHNARSYKTCIRPLSLMAFIKSNYNWKHCPSSTNIQLIPLGSNRPDFIDRIYCPRKKNYNSPKPCFKQSHLQENNMGRYSKACKYTRYTYSPMVQSFGYLINKSSMYIRIDSNRGTISRLISSPRGFHFCIDNNGLKLQSNSIKSMDYHFTALDLIVGNSERNPLKTIVNKCKANYQTRKQAKLQSAIFSDDPKQVNKVIREAERLKVQISVVDSIKAGNCLAGTQVWAMRNHLSTSNHYQIQSITDKLDGENRDRVKLVILRAIERTKQELDRGYSLLQDHYMDYQTN